MSKLSWSIKACSVVLSLAGIVTLRGQTVQSPPPTLTFTTLFSFGGLDSGYWPVAPLVQATDGDLYGTTPSGGKGSDSCVSGCGVAFKITTTGAGARLHNFSFNEGYQPRTALIQSADGNFYGTAVAGGVGGFGTVFKITPDGMVTRLYSFCSQHSDCTNGSTPEAPLIQASDGNFYGTTSDADISSPNGTIFKITPSGLTTLFSFDTVDGSAPTGALIQASDGEFYGTTSEGGTNGYGTVYKMTSDGLVTTLYNFDKTDGGHPQAGLVQGVDGNFYGTTFQGGGGNICQLGCGTVFKITPNGALTSLHIFAFTDGAYPSGVVQATDGNLYGTTNEGGANDGGTVFSISTSGALTTLYNFCSQYIEHICTDGAGSTAALAQDTDGSFYGTTEIGGAKNRGAIFNLSIGLDPFVETNPASGTAGTTINILGTNLTGATGVTFNGTAAAFTVTSSSQITTTVPPGATTGTVQVVTPRGTLSSNVPFQVLP